MLCVGGQTCCCIDEFFENYFNTVYCMGISSDFRMRFDSKTEV